MVNSTSCLFPDGVTNGSTNNPEFVPCDPSAPESACCATGETCVGSGLCLSATGLIYRGGCTDATFQNSACPSICTDGGTGRNSGPQNSWVFLKACDESTGKLQWVCDLTGNCSDTTMRFNLLVGNVKEVNITGNLASSSSISSAVSTSSTSTSNPKTKDCSTQTGASATTVGAGVGIPLGILLILSIIWALWERQRSTKYAKSVQSSFQKYDAIPVTPKYAMAQEAPDNVKRSELPPTPHGYVSTHEMG